MILEEACLKNKIQHIWHKMSSPSLPEGNDHHSHLPNNQQAAAKTKNMVTKVLVQLQMLQMKLLQLLWTGTSCFGLEQPVGSNQSQ